MLLSVSFFLCFYRCLIYVTSCLIHFSFQFMIRFYLYFACLYFLVYLFVSLVFVSPFFTVWLFFYSNNLCFLVYLFISSVFVFSFFTVCLFFYFTYLYYLVYLFMLSLFVSVVCGLLTIYAFHLILNFVATFSVSCTIFYLKVLYSQLFFSYNIFSSPQFMFLLFQFPLICNIPSLISIFYFYSVHDFHFLQFYIYLLFSLYKFTFHFTSISFLQFIYLIFLQQPNAFCNSFQHKHILYSLSV